MGHIATGSFVRGCLLVLAIPLIGVVGMLRAEGPEPAPARRFWSFQPLRKPSVPDVRDIAWPRSDIDRFLLAQQEVQGLHPVADAAPEVLVRRVSFDLTGLPPSTAMLDAFAKDPTPQAFARLVDDLLASRAFGERWGRHWLDVARYAESTGKDRNHAFPEAWRYRDWVIAAVQRDMPYDEFIRRQIAGDLVSARNAAERDENLIATGFLAIGPKGLNERRRDQFLMDVVDEQIDVTTRAVMGLSVGCARCHDHKSDPVSQRDYYALAGIFRSTQVLYGTEGSQGNRQPSGLFELGLGLDREDLRPVAARSDETVGRQERRLRRNPAAARATAAGRADPERPMPALPSTNGPRAMGVREGVVMDCALLVRGEVTQRGERIPRALLPWVGGETPPVIPRGESGRLQLATWLTDPANPLTARVQANRVWLHLFGRGLVRTADDFGAGGERPSNPALLDHLAVRLQEGGWSMKALIREIVLSRTYALSSTVDARALELDPDNLLLWRSSPRRLDAESLRDAMLAVSGLLDPGPPGRSPVAALGDGRLGPGMGSLRSDPVRTRRSVYLPIVRGFVPESLELFDFAEPSLVVAERETTNVPAQALFLMNNPGVVQMAGAFARRLFEDAGPGPWERVDRAYRLAFGRHPTPDERRRALEFIRTQRVEGLEGARRRDPLMESHAAWTSFTQALLASAEFRFLR
jgi:hypothetical protein